MTTTEFECPLHGSTASVGSDAVDIAKAPGHWVLARMGKRVLRPGGLGLTRTMLAAMEIAYDDHVVEFAPGLGVTAQMTLKHAPASYTAIERDERAAAQVRRWLDAARDPRPRQVITGVAQDTGLPDACATVVYGEAMLTMQTETRKRQIVREAFRLLRPGGRYGIHELCIAPDDLPESEADQVRRGIAGAIKHQALPLTAREWTALLRAEGFEVVHRAATPMALLSPARLIRDEGFLGALRFGWRVLRDRQGRKRVIGMRRAFRAHRRHIAAICLVARKRAEGGDAA
jgi:hypothetical protein